MREGLYKTSRNQALVDCDLSWLESPIRLSLLSPPSPTPRKDGERQRQAAAGRGGWEGGGGGGVDRRVRVPAQASRVQPLSTALQGTLAAQIHSSQVLALPVCPVLRSWMANWRLAQSVLRAAQLIGFARDQTLLPGEEIPFGLELTTLVG